MRWLAGLLVAQVALMTVLVVLVATDNVPFVRNLRDGGGGDGDAAASVPKATAGRFDGAAAYASVRRQVALGPRPAGSPASRRLAERLRRALPAGRFQAVPGGLRNVVGVVPGRDRRRLVVVGAHYDTKDQKGFVGAEDGAGGAAILTQLARTVKPRTLRSTVVFIAFDGEEAPAGTADVDFERVALRGSKVAAHRYSRARSMVLLDFVGQKGLRIPREASSNGPLWGRLRAASKRAGVARVFPSGRTQGAIVDDHTPFQRAGVPAIDLIDFDYACFHRSCDDLSQISQRSLDAVGETMLELLPRL
ncbi:MAG: M28 family peptidase [Thermoleophilaceae bacterium]